MRIIPIFVFLLLLLSSCKEAVNETQLLHDNWQFSNSKDTIWMPAQVPGVVQTDLLRLNKIPHPFKGNNEDSIQWISEENWNYKTSFSVSEETLEKPKHFLRFEGLDTYASVVLNDSLLLKVNNAMRSWELDVSDLVKANNNLEIYFESVDSIEMREAAKLEYQLPEAPRVFTRKPQFQYGWDWGPTIKTMGIWRDVSLISYDAARIKDAYIETVSITTSEAQLMAKLELESWEPSDLTIEIENKLTGEIIEKEILVIPEQLKYQIPFQITNPKLWWTHNLGEPYLYEFEIRLIKENTSVDKITKKVGVRTIELITNKDNKGEGFYFELNGNPVYMKGANYIPQDIFLAEVNEEKREQLLDDVVEANMNMLRVWGGGVYEDDLFYDLCDEKGVLIWQDFMFACAMYPGDEEFLENVKQEAIENVKRLRQHPSIALWCGNNENSEGWARWGWADDKTTEQRAKIWSDYRAVFNHILPRVVDSLHQDINYWESSPKYGRGDKRYQFEGDAHDWWVWHDGYPFEHFEEEVPRFMSEFGFQSFPSYEAIRNFTEQDSIDLSHPSFGNHQKHSRGFSLIREYMARDYPVPENGEDYVYVSQLLQARGIIMGIEAHRRAKPYNMGTLYWQLNDCWPVVSWSSIDGLGNWKALHYKVKHAFENVIVSSIEKEDTLNLYVINDTFEEKIGTFKTKLMDFSGLVIDSSEREIEVNPDASNLHTKFTLKKMNFDRTKTVLLAEFDGIQHLHYFEAPKNLKLQNKEIYTKIVKNEKGFLITLQTTTLQKDVFLFTGEKGKFDENYFDLLPNEPKTVQFLTKRGKIDLKIKTINQLIK